MSVSRTSPERSCYWEADCTRIPGTKPGEPYVLTTVPDNRVIRAVLSDGRFVLEAYLKLLHFEGPLHYSFFGKPNDDTGIQRIMAISTASIEGVFGRSKDRKQQVDN